MLTAPFLERPSGLIRGILLALTDAFPFFFWLCGCSFFKDGFSSKAWPVWLKVLVGLLVVWHLVFFIGFKGLGYYHDLNHFFGLALIAHLLILALAGMNDDLLEGRRKARIVFVIVVCVIFAVLELVELSGTDLNRNRLFSVTVAGLGFFITNIIAIYTNVRPLNDQQGRAPDKVNIEPARQKIFESLMAFIESGGYRQEGLSMNQLASRLAYPPHQLRALINTTLGYRNFSAFLNHYRLDDACCRLRNKTYNHLPILTIALEVGYSSIGPFNRAFKLSLKQTPSQYRKCFKTLD